MADNAASAAPAPPNKNTQAHQQCLNFVAATMMNGSGKFISVIAAYVLSRVAHHLLKPLSQPYMTSDLLVGVILGTIPHVRQSFVDQIILTLDNIVDFGMICYMFVLGLEMDPYGIFRTPSRNAIVSFAATLSTFIIACATTPLLHYSKNTFILTFTISLSINLSGNGSHILTRLITNLKIGKSDIGKLGIGAGVHCDMITMFLLSIGFVFMPDKPDSTLHEYIQDTTRMTFALLIQTILAAKISPIFMNWVNNENPEGKPMKGSHLVLSMAFMAIICTCAPWYGYNSFMSAFMAGLFLPSDGRISKWTINKLNYLLSTLFYPLFFFWVGLKLDFPSFRVTDAQTWIRFSTLLGITILGKVIGTVICGLLLGYHFVELVSLGLLLTPKGHFNVYFALYALRQGFITMTTCISMVIVVFLSVVHIPFVVKHIIARARKRVPTHRMALQWMDPTTQLKALVCIHEPQNLPSMVNLMEISRGTPQPGIMVYVTDMIELTDQIAATIVQGEEEDGGGIAINDPLIMEMRNHVTRTFDDYMSNDDYGGAGITINRMLAISAFNGMAQDVSILAEDVMATLILLPFHKKLNADGNLDAGHQGFRYVNRKLLRNGPCSIGILVDRGFGNIKRISRSSVCEVAIIFIGGKDDREALAYAGRVARHPGVKLTVIRFLVDKNSENAPRRVNHRVSVAEQEEEMKADDECFAEFYEKHVAGGKVAYMEKHLANSSETYTNLKALGGQYSLIIVGLGRGGRVNTVLTLGLNDWQQCPELGPVGDVLSGSSFANDTSILVIQQHSIRGQIDGLNDEFSIM